jgi:malonyl-CoA/methylmalonyl-CoA synthetase
MIELIRRRRPLDGSTMLLCEPGGTLVTYDDADRLVGRLANTLRSNGARPGDRVVVQADKSPTALFLYLACLRSGAVFLPLNTAYSDAEVGYVLRDARPSVAVCDPARRDAFVGPEVLTLDGFGNGTLAESAAAQADAFEDVPVDPDDVAALLYTSGTTGRPKGAILSQGNLAANAVALHRVWGFRPDDVLLHALPVYHAHGLFVATNCVLANGTGMVFLPRFDVDAVIGQLSRCTVFMGVPTYYTRLLGDRRLDPERCRGVRLFVSGSAPLTETTHREFLDRTGHSILERYGTTETLMITSNPLVGERRAGAVGFALAGVRLRVTDPDTGHPEPAGAVGQIEVTGPSVMPGYWSGGPPSTSPPVRLDFTADGFFRTGDLGLIDQDGYLRIVGRLKDLIITGGLNVYPKEVEDVLDELDDVLESAVVGLPDADFGEQVAAAVVARPGRTVDESVVRQAARRRLAPFKVPKRVFVLDELPRNSMGKIEKAGLRRRLADG